MTESQCRLVVSKKTYLLVLNECKEEMIRANPHLGFDGVKITQELIVSRIAQYYLK